VRRKVLCSYRVLKQEPLIPIIISISKIRDDDGDGGDNGGDGGDNGGDGFIWEYCLLYSISFRIFLLEMNFKPHD
jgi:hypothetical protein